MPLEAPVTRASFRASITGGNYPASGFPNQPGDAPFWARKDSIAARG